MKDSLLTIDVFDQKAQKVKTLDLYSGFLKGKLYDFLVNECVRKYRASQRQGNASSKTKAEVAGSGAKPWKQKGSGRARSGSRQNPVWRGGGIIFGPKPRNYSFSLPKKMKQRALLSVLRSRFIERQLLVVDDWKIETGKTKDFCQILEKFGIQEKTLFVNEDKKENMLRASGNLQMVSVQQGSFLNALDVLYFPKVIFTEKAILDVQNRLCAKEMSSS